MMPLTEQVPNTAEEVTAVIAGAMSGIGAPVSSGKYTIPSPFQK